MTQAQKQELLYHFTQRELDNMDEQEQLEILEEIEHEANIGIIEQEEEQHEEYLRSQQYMNDCRSEQWDWLQNEYTP